MSSKIAFAIPKDRGSTLYEVRYAGSSDFDSGVPYAYLRKLAEDGYRVDVSGDGPEYTIYPTDSAQPEEP